MAFRLCHGDPVVDALRETFGANILRVPEQRYKLLCVVASRNHRTAFGGELAPLLEGSPILEIPDSAKADSRMADLTNRESSAVEVGTGLRILNGFLSGFGIPAGRLDARFSGATEVAYAFHRVTRTWIDNNWLGRTLAQRAVDRNNRNAAIYFRKPKWNLLLIDSIITSSAFTITVKQTASDSFKLDLPAISELVGSLELGIDVASANERQVTFRGPQQLTFACTLLRLHLMADGRISALEPEDTTRVLAAAPEGQVHHVGFTHVELLAEPGMLEFEEGDLTAG